MTHTQSTEGALTLDAAFYDLLMDASGAIYTALAAARRREQPEPPPAILQLRAGLAESPGWFLLQAAEFDPEPLTVAALRVRDTYASEHIVGALLNLMVSEGWLDRDGDAYPLTAEGRAFVGALLERRQRLLAGVALLPPADAARLSELLDAVVAASMEAPEPPGIWCLAHSRRRAPPPDAPVFARLLQSFEDLNAVRDDAHMAAWRPLGVDGRAWEAFALVCAGAADSAAAIFAKLAYRGYARREYADALEELAGRGWLEPAGSPGAYRVAAASAEVRAEVERLTDAFFYAPWARLAAGELEEIRALATALRDAA